MFNKCRVGCTMIIPGSFGASFQQRFIRARPWAVKGICGSQAYPFSISFAVGIAHEEQAVFTIHKLYRRVMAGCGIPKTGSARREHDALELKFALRRISYGMANLRPVDPAAHFLRFYPA